MPDHSSCADGIQSKVVAAELGVYEHTVGKWRRRFLKDRAEGLLDEARPGRTRTIEDDQVAAVIERTLRSKPVDATQWSIRSMAGVTGFSHTTIRHLGRLRAPAAPLGDVQAVERPAVRWQGARHRRALSIASQPRPRPQRR
jgi:hypothetical protein